MAGLASYLLSIKNIRWKRLTLRRHSQGHFWILLLNGKLNLYFSPPQRYMEIHLNPISQPLKVLRDLSPVSDLERVTTKAKEWERRFAMYTATIMM